MIFHLFFELIICKNYVYGAECLHLKLMLVTCRKQQMRIYRRSPLLEFHWPTKLCHQICGFSKNHSVRERRHSAHTKKGNIFEYFKISIQVWYLIVLFCSRQYLWHSWRCWGCVCFLFLMLKSFRRAGRRKKSKEPFCQRVSDNLFPSPWISWRITFHQSPALSLFRSLCVYF